MSKKPYSEPKPTFKCSLCGGDGYGYGHNPEPLLPYKRRCCDSCNSERVIPARLGFAVKAFDKSRGVG